MRVRKKGAKRKLNPLLFSSECGRDQWFFSIQISIDFQRGRGLEFSLCKRRNITRREEHRKAHQRFPVQPRGGPVWKTSAHQNSKARGQPKVDIAKRASSVAAQAPPDITIVLVSTWVQRTTKISERNLNLKRNRTRTAVLTSATKPKIKHLPARGSHEILEVPAPQARPPTGPLSKESGPVVV